MAENTTAQATCGRCGRVLKSERARRCGYGRSCRALVLKAEREARASQEFTPAQVEKARELIEDVAVIRIRPGIYLAVSTDGTEVYRCAKQGCSCPASKPCYHMLAVAILESDGIPQRRTAIAIPARRTVPAARKETVMEYPAVFANPIEEIRTEYRAAYLESKAARAEYKSAILAENAHPAMYRDYRALSAMSDYEIAAHAVVCESRARMCAVVGPDNI